MVDGYVNGPATDEPVYSLILFVLTMDQITICIVTGVFFSDPQRTIT